MEIERILEDLKKKSKDEIAQINVTNLRKEIENIKVNPVVKRKEYLKRKSKSIILKKKLK